MKKHLGIKAVPQTDLPLVTRDGYVKIEPLIVLDTRAVPRGETVVTQWLIQWINLHQNEATWEDKSFIKAVFPGFYYRTIKEWFPDTNPCGQGSSQGEGNCQALQLSEPDELKKLKATAAEKSKTETRD